MSTWSFDSWGSASPGYLGRANVTNDTFDFGDFPTPIVNPIVVGSIFFTESNTNPATLLGYGTWVAFGGGTLEIGPDPKSDIVYVWERTA